MYSWSRPFSSTVMSVNTKPNSINWLKIGSVLLTQLWTRNKQTLLVYYTSSAHTSWFLILLAPPCALTHQRSLTFTLQSLNQLLLISWIISQLSFFINYFISLRCIKYPPVMLASLLWWKFCLSVFSSMQIAIKRMWMAENRLEMLS